MINRKYLGDRFLMAKVIGVKFKNSGKSYFFDPAGFDVHKYDHVIVETGKGIDYGFVVSDIREISESKLFQPLKPILRKATERDEVQVAENHEKEKEAFRICQEKVHEHNLDMKLTEAEYAFDNSKILFYFTSDGYVDFRDLVKDLASIFKTRIELRQIGVRDEARAIGGLGACGRPMCCAAYLNDFVPVSIKMAKEQNLPLNPTKISGVCGRLMCCLKYEEDTYEELNRTMPDVGDFVEGFDGLKGDVFSTNVLKQTIKVIVEEGDEKELHDYEVGQFTVLRKRRGKKNTKIEDEVDEKQLAALEDNVTEPAEKKNERKHDDKRSEKKWENRHENKQEGKQENRQDNKSEVKPNSGQDNKHENKSENRHDNKENRGDRKNGDRKFDGKKLEDRKQGKAPEETAEGEKNFHKKHHYNNKRHDKHRGNKNDGKQGSPAGGNGEN